MERKNNQPNKNVARINDHWTIQDKLIDKAQNRYHWKKHEAFLLNILFSNKYTLVGVEE